MTDYKITRVKGADVIVSFEVCCTEQYCITQSNIAFSLGVSSLFRYYLFGKLGSGRKLYFHRSSYEVNSLVAEKVDAYMVSRGDVCHFYNIRQLVLPDKL